MKVDAWQALAAVVAINAVIWAIGLPLAHRGPNRRQRALFDEKTSAGARVRAMVMIREGFLEEPGVAQIRANRLEIFTITGKAIIAPLDEVRLTKFVARNYLGRYPWIRKALFHLEAPGTTRLVLGVRDAEPWRSFLVERPS